MHFTSPFRAPGLRARLAVALVFVVVMSTISACDTIVESTKVLVVGDSILNQSVDEVRAELEQHGWAPVIVAYGGTAIEQWITHLPRLVAEHDASVVVLELGTNNCAEDVCPLIQDQINQALQAVEGAEQIVWLDVQTAPDYPKGAEDVNAALAAAEQSTPNLEIIDFSEEFAGHPEWLDQQGPHLTDAGQIAFARLIADALADFRVVGS